MTGRLRPSTLRWRVYLLVGGVVALLLATVAATSLARLRAADLNSELRGTLRPAQASVATLSKAFVDMETGVRGFLLSGQRQLLAPYRTGRTEAESARKRLGELLASDAAATRLLTSVDRAADVWQRRTAGPAVSDPPSDETVAQATVTGKRLFDAVRGLLGELRRHIDRRTAATVERSTDAQSAANLVTILCTSLALVIGAVIVVLLQRSLVRPVNRLVANVRRVSSGDLGHPVVAHGPAEVISLGDAVESMRERILRENARAARSSAQLVRLQEADRIAQDLGETTIRDLFSISLALQSAAARYPSAAATLTVVTDDVDRVLAEIRSSVFGSPSEEGRSVRAEVRDAVAGLDDLRLRLSGAVDHPAPVALTALLQDVFPLLPAAAEVLVDVSDTHVRTHLTSPPAPAALTAAARTHSAKVTQHQEQTTIEWSTPL